MAFTFVVSLFFLMMVSVAAVAESCLFRLEHFRKTQQQEFPELCRLINKIWRFLHLSSIFDLSEDDEPYEETEMQSASPSLHVVRKTVSVRSHSYRQAA